MNKAAAGGSNFRAVSQNPQQTAESVTKVIDYCHIRRHCAGRTPNETPERKDKAMLSRRWSALSSLAFKKRRKWSRRVEWRGHKDRLSCIWIKPLPEGVTSYLSPEEGLENSMLRLVYTCLTNERHSNSWNGGKFWSSFGNRWRQQQIPN